MKKVTGIFILMSILSGCGLFQSDVTLEVPAVIYRGNAVTVSLNVSSGSDTLFLFQSTSLTPSQPVLTLPFEGLSSTNVTFTSARYGTATTETFTLRLANDESFVLEETRNLSHYSHTLLATNAGDIGTLDIFDMYEVVVTNTTNLRLTLIDIRSNLSLSLLDAVGGTVIDSDGSANSPTNVVTASDITAGTYFIKVDCGTYPTTNSAYRLYSEYTL